jgi:hypothetical protein
LQSEPVTSPVVVIMPGGTIRVVFMSQPIGIVVGLNHGLVHA